MKSYIEISDDGKIILNVDEINVGQIKITKTPDGGAGIWFGNGKEKHMIALFQVQNQLGIGIYSKGSGNCNICLSLDDKGNPFIQFIDKRGETVFLTFDDIKALGKD